ncbi:galactokinase [Herbiconiux sp. L3-i23]|uniref:galactokinase n=1 Tax=Herbiconiux sp. L3-i23 TaxID=2905871 RepID=UPI00206B6114|nr:galactokinase [Herbiconiux sp. L3-i23]BDI23774.1 galactokinase [Herbiconiux sp. L3-i23]
MTDVRSDTLSGFAERYGHTALSLWSGPGRVNLIGEHTDYNEGFVLPFAIDRRTFVAMRPRQDSLARVGSSFAPETVEIDLADLRAENVDGWSAYPLGVAWAIGQFTGGSVPTRGFDLYVHSDVPVGAGLSSSAAIESATALALNDLWETDLDRRTLARVGQLAENKAVGAPTGIMDQSASLLGETDAGVFLDCRSLDAEVIGLGFEPAGLAVVVIDTRVSHAHATGGYASRRASCEAGARTLGVEALRDVGIARLDEAREMLDDETFRRVRHVVTEDQRVLDTVRTLREKGADAIGELLVASHVSMRDDFEISVPELDLAVESALGAGAMGARMTGGGFGGAAIALTPIDRVEAVRAAATRAFADASFREPISFTVVPSAGARRED